MARLFSDYQEQFIKDNATGVGNKELTELINETFGLDVSTQQVKAWKNRQNVTSGLTGHFKKGCIPYNKGKKMKTVGNMAKTQFKPGHQPKNYKNIGYSRVDRDGYVLVKVRDDGPWHKRWRHKHKIVWEEENGPIPEGHVVIFLDGDRANITIENLKLITRRELMVMNQNGWKFEDEKLTKTGVLMSKLSIEIQEKRKNI